MTPEELTAIRDRANAADIPALLDEIEGALAILGSVDEPFPETLEGHIRFLLSEREFYQKLDWEKAAAQWLTERDEARKQLAELRDAAQEILDTASPSPQDNDAYDPFHEVPDDAIAALDAALAASIQVEPS